MTDRSDRQYRWIGPLLFIGSLILYLATMSEYPYPGESVGFVAQHTGRLPFLDWTHGLWYWVSGLAASIPVSTLTVRLSVFSALCGAAIVWLMYAIQIRIPHDTGEQDGRKTDSLSPENRLTGIVSAIFVACSIPLWIASNRAGPYPFDALLYVAVAFCVLTYLRTYSQATLYTACFLIGLGVFENAAFVLTMPLYALYLLVGMVKGKQLRVWVLVRALCCFLLGASLIFALALSYVEHPSAEWVGVETYWEMVINVVKIQYATVRLTIRRVGWLLVFFTCIVPWMMVLMIPAPRMKSREAVWGGMLLHVILAVVAVSLLFNAGFAPARALAGTGVPVIAYVFAASWIGYLAGNWYLQLCKPRSPGRGFLSGKWGRVSRRAFVVVFVVGLTVAAVLNFSWAEARQGDFVSRLAQLTVGHLDGRATVMGSGFLLPHIEVAAHEADTELRIIDVGSIGGKAYRKHLLESFADPRLKRAVAIGPVPLTRQILQVTPNVARKLAVLDSADLLVLAGTEPVPERLYFRPRVEDEDIDLDALMARHEAFWKEDKDLWAEPITPRDPLLSDYATYVPAVLSKVANNLGVLLEDSDRLDLAMQAYTQARTISSDNLSALLNLYSVARRLESVQYPSIKEELESITDAGSAQNLWSLSSRYGYVRNPFAFRDMGMAWAMSGRTQLGIRQLERASELGAQGGNVRGALGALYLAEDELDKSAEQYEAVLANRPEHIGALIGMARVAATRKDAAVAEDYLARAEAAGAGWTAVNVERAILSLTQGRHDDAYDLLTEIVIKSDDLINVGEPASEEAHVMLARLRLARGELERAQELLHKPVLKSAQQPGPLRIIARMHQIMGHPDEARAYYERSLAARPGDTSVMESLVMLDLDEGKLGPARKLSILLLNVEPDNPIGNFAMGLVEQIRGDKGAAEGFYRTALAGTREPGALNNLAWLLQERNELEEAISLAEECVEVDPEYVNGWDTLGYCYLRAKQYDLSLEALAEAVRRAPGKLSFTLHLLELHRLMGNMEAATEIERSLRGRSLEMSPDQLARFQELSGRE